MVRVQNQPTLRVYDTGTITCTTTTDTQATEVITGEIIKVEIIASASSNFKLLVDASDDNTSAIVDQYILGASDSAVTVNTTGVYYPAQLMVLPAGTATDPDQFSNHFVDDALEIAASNVANHDTYRVKIYYIPYRKI